MDIEGPPDFDPGDLVRIDVEPYKGTTASVFGVMTNRTRLGWDQQLLLELSILNAIIVPSHAVTKL